MEVDIAAQNKFGTAVNSKLGHANNTQTRGDDDTRPSQQSNLEVAKSKKLENNYELHFALGLIVLSVTIFILGNKYWDERYYTPDEGLGYYMGLVGGCMMLLAFGYTLFKYVPLFRSKTVMKFWLTLHLMFGILGPLLIMFHSTFRIGSVNGAAALISMGVMFYSGVMARFLYSRTHINLDGKLASVKALKEALRVAGRTVKSERLDNFTTSVIKQQNDLLSAIWLLVSFGWRSRMIYWRLTSDLHHHLSLIAKKEGWSTSTVRQKKRDFKKQLLNYIFTLKKVAFFNFYVRFFTFWRFAHVPISILLLMSGLVHVLAVHMY